MPITKSIIVILTTTVAAQALQFEPSVQAAYGLEDGYGLGYEVHARLHTELGLYAGAVFSQFPSGEYHVKIPGRFAQPFENDSSVESFYYGLSLGYRLHVSQFDFGFELRGVQVEERYDGYVYAPNDGPPLPQSFEESTLELIPAVEVGYNIDSLRLALGAAWIAGQDVKIGVNSLTTERDSLILTAGIGYAF